MTKLNLEKKAVVALLVALWMIVAMVLPVMGLPDDDPTDPTEAPPPATQTPTEAPPTPTEKPPVETDTPPAETDTPPTETDEPVDTSNEDKTSYNGGGGGTETRYNDDDDDEDYDYDTRTSSRSQGSYDIGQDEKTSIYYYDNDKDLSSMAWGTLFSEETTTETPKIRKNIANYSELMHRIIWIPIALAVLSVGTLIYINVKAGKMKKER